MSLNHLHLGSNAGFMGASTSISTESNEAPILTTRVRACHEQEFVRLQFLDYLIRDYAGDLPTVELAIKYLARFHYPSALVADEKATNALLFLSHTANTSFFSENSTKIKGFQIYEVEKCFSKVLDYCWSDFGQFVTKFQFIESNNSSGECLRLKRVFIIVDALVSSMNKICAHRLFYAKNQEQRKFEIVQFCGILLNYIGDESLVMGCKMLKRKKCDKSRPTKGVKFLCQLIRSFEHLTQLLTEHCQTSWRKLHPLEKVNNFLRVMSAPKEVAGSKQCASIALFSLSNIMTDEELEQDPNIKQFILETIGLVNVAAKAIEAMNSKRHGTGRKVEEEEEEEEEEVVVVKEDEEDFSIVQLLNRLNKLSASDSLKHFIYASGNFKENLKTIIMHGSLIEKESATKLMWQLSFHSQVAQVINSDKEMLDFIEKLGSVEDGPLSRSCNGIMWQTRKSNRRSHRRVTDYVRDVTPKLLKSSSHLLGQCSPPSLLASVSNSNIKRSERGSIPNLTLGAPAPVLNGHRSPRARASSTPSGALEQQDQLGKAAFEQQEASALVGTEEKQLLAQNADTGHIMISYNSKSRELCLQIKQFLEGLHYKVWIDVENISGSSLESMANAIENSTCVLICMTEKYRQSPNCRAECEYAFNLRKPIVPLIMQEEFVPDGWLGIVLGTKIYINFTKGSFEQCASKLQKEIVNVAFNGIGPVIETKDTIQTDQIKPAVKKASEWTNEEVVIWINAKNLHPALASELAVFDGELLDQLFKISKTAPEAFFRELNKSGQLDLLSIVRFVNELERLF